LSRGATGQSPLDHRMELALLQNHETDGLRDAFADAFDSRPLWRATILACDYERALS